jgi:hypothetical protein
MATFCKEREVAISYHTQTDTELANALKEALKAINVAAVFLPYLAIGAIRTRAPEYPSGGLCKDAWIDHFLKILENAKGMIIIHTQNSLGSESGGGMNIEKKLAEYIEPSTPEFILRLEHPILRHAIESQPRPEPQELVDLRQQLDATLDVLEKYGHNWAASDRRINQLQIRIAELEDELRPDPLPPPPDISPAEWAQSILRDIKLWIDGREKQKIPRPSRVQSAIVNIPGYFDLHEADLARSENCWYLLSVLDLYDCVWHCRSCFSTSDVWMRTDYRPPDACPNCGYGRLARGGGFIT